jgi:hypothetical protein
MREIRVDAVPFFGWSSLVHRYGTPTGKRRLRERLPAVSSAYTALSTEGT